MWVSLNPLHPSPPPPKILLNPSSPVFPTHQTLIFPHHRPIKPRTNFLTRSSLHDSQTLPYSPIQRIADKLRSLGYTEDDSILTTKTEANSAGEIFIPLPNQLAKYRVGHTLDPSWSTPDNPVPRPGSGNVIVNYLHLRNEAKEERQRWKREQRERVPTLAELSLSKEELRRLKTVGIAERRKLKVGKAGITEGIVNGIHERWKREEVVKIVCEDLCRMNMKRTHDLLERKTGGLVVWRSGSKIILYRGANYQYPYFSMDTTNETSGAAENACRSDEGIEKIDKTGSSSNHIDEARAFGPNVVNKMNRTLIQGVGSPNRVRFPLPGEVQLAEEADCLLDGLGPRFTDWWGCDPLPVDADLLPAFVSEYRRPFRLLPYGVKHKLTNDEMTALKRLGRPLPCHFALGRNKKLQGLAASIVKLWEKCEIAKIAVKRGVQNTNSELMAEELKWLTGGTLLSRDREFIVLYRGKDFLPSAVASAIEERRNQRIYGANQSLDHSELGTIADDCKDNTQIETAINRTSIKLSMAIEKKAKAEKLLMELEKAEVSQQPEADKEGITEEERYMLRKIGLKMKPFLLMGRRGVFDGTVENMHLHWKHRELVKLVCKESSIEDAHNVASILEAESGGILVAVESVSKGYAIIVYRGKNYKRPASLRPSTLLSKGQAMKRSLEAQRQQSLKLHVLRLNRNIDNLRLQLVEEEGKSIEIARDGISDTELKSDHHSYAAITTESRENIGATEKDGVNTIPLNLNDGLDASANIMQPSQQANQSEISSTFVENAIERSQPESLSEPVIQEILEIQLADSNGGGVSSAPCPDSFLAEDGRYSYFSQVKHRVSRKTDKLSRVISVKNEFDEPVLMKVEEANHKSSGAVQLSNRERLLLRRQALKMKKCPVFAVGRSNVVSDMTKVIKAHFQKHPFAIVNVKGRAKGTSVQEVVFELEQATGAVLVSQEPSKVILYRGWGVDLKPVYKNKKNVRHAGKITVGGEGSVRQAVSPDLMAAIRHERGLQLN